MSTDTIKVKIALWALTMLSVGLIAGCGGGEEAEYPTKTASQVKIPLTDNTARPAFEPRVSGLTKLSERRIGRTVYEYTFGPEFTGGTLPALNVVSRIVSVGRGTTVIDGESRLSTIDADTSTVSADTITLRHDRTLPFEPENIKWVTEASQNPESLFATLPTSGGTVSTPSANLVITAPDDASGIDRSLKAVPLASQARSVNSVVGAVYRITLDSAPSAKLFKLEIKFDKSKLPSSIRPEQLRLAYVRDGEFVYVRTEYDATRSVLTTWTNKFSDWAIVPTATTPSYAIRPGYTLPAWSWLPVEESTAPCSKVTGDFQKTSYMTEVEKLARRLFLDQIEINDSYSELYDVGCITLPYLAERYALNFSTKNEKGVWSITNDVHAGIDFRAQEAQIAHAVLPGKVIRGGDNADDPLEYQGLDISNGTSTLIIESELSNVKYWIFYLHCSSHHGLRPGAEIKAGDKVCTTGSVGAAGAHLHFEVKRIDQDIGVLGGVSAGRSACTGSATGPDAVTISPGCSLSEVVAKTVDPTVLVATVSAISVRGAYCTTPAVGLPMECTIEGTGLTGSVSASATNCQPRLMERQQPIYEADGTSKSLKFTCIPEKVGDVVQFGYRVPSFIGPLPPVPSRVAIRNFASIEELKANFRLDDEDFCGETGRSGGAIALSSGKFVATWIDFTPAKPCPTTTITGSRGVGQVFGNDGSASGVKILFRGALGTGGLEQPMLTALPEGQFVAAIHEYSSAPNRYVVSLQRYNDGGSTIGDPYILCESHTVLGCAIIGLQSSGAGTVAALVEYRTNDNIISHDLVLLDKNLLQKRRVAVSLAHTSYNSSFTYLRYGGQGLLTTSATSFLIVERSADYSDVILRQIDENGEDLGVRISIGSPGYGFISSIRAIQLGHDQLVVAWGEERYDSNYRFLNNSVRLGVFSKDGVTRRVSTLTDEAHWFPYAAISPVGADSFAVAYTIYSGPEYQRDRSTAVQLRIFSLTDGSLRGSAETTANASYTFGPTLQPALGDKVLLVSSYENYDPYIYGVRGQIFDHSGAPQGVEHEFKDIYGSESDVLVDSTSSYLMMANRLINIGGGRFLLYDAASRAKIFKARLN